MIDLESAKAKLEEYEAKRMELLAFLKEKYRNMEEEFGEHIEESISLMDWNDQRDLVYYDDLCHEQEVLAGLLERLGSNDKKIVHQARKDMEWLLREARLIRAEREEDIAKAQEVIDGMNEIISCLTETHTHK